MKLINMKNKFYRKVFQGSPTEKQVQQYKKFKNYVLNQIRRAKKAYYMNALSKDASSFYQCLRSFTGKVKTSTSIDKLIMDGETIENETEIANALNKFFTNLPDKIQPTRLDYENLKVSDAKNKILFHFKNTTSDLVYKQIMSLQ